jgi:hypothetical protein
MLLPAATTHLQNLNNVSAYDAGQQWGLNQVMATRLGITTGKGLSAKGVVTPQITGLFNVSALLECDSASWQLGW